MTIAFSPFFIGWDERTAAHAHSFGKIRFSVGKESTKSPGCGASRDWIVQPQAAGRDASVTKEKPEAL
jgi:hypothetical protein